MPSSPAQPTNRSSAITANRRTAARSTNGSIIARYSSGVRPVPRGRSVPLFFPSWWVPQSFPRQRLSRRLRAGSFRSEAILDLLQRKTAVANIPDQTTRVDEDGRGPDARTVSERNVPLRVGHHDGRQPMLSDGLFDQFSGFPVVDCQHCRPLRSRLANRFLQLTQRLEARLRCTFPENENDRTPHKLLQGEFPAGSVLEDKVRRRLAYSHACLQQTRTETCAGYQMRPECRRKIGAGEFALVMPHDIS